MVQRVGLAQALVNDPELVILDEPMSGLDPIGRREVRELILRLRDEGRTVLFSSHILSDAELLCSRVGILAQGRLVASGTLTELTAARRPRRMGSGRDAASPTRAGRAAGARRVRRVTCIADGRYSFELPADERGPSRSSPSWPRPARRSCRSLPLRTTLEDVFLERGDR